MFRNRLALIVSAAALLLAHSAANISTAAENPTPATHERTDANIYGHVTSNGTHLPYVQIHIVGTTISTITDITGHYRIIDLPVGTHTVEASVLGYTTKQMSVTLERGKSIEVDFALEEDYLQMDAVVVTGDKQALTRREAGSVISAVTPKLLSATSAVTISEGLSFVPGLRMENNCQNCGFNQVRMNGMPGPYSQVLVDGRPIFGSVMGVYGMELVPANMVDRIEVLRGGGSSLYGSSAVAGSVNLILKDPAFNTFALDYMQGFSGVGIKGSGGATPDYKISLNASVLTPDSKAGLSLDGSFRQRNPFDYNGDAFSELPLLRSATIGTRAFYRVTPRGKLSATYFYISEKRRGGDRFEYPIHVANIAEGPTHSINNASIQYNQFFRENDQLVVNASLLHIDRDSYYGGNSLKDYGITKNITYSAMAHYITAFSNWGTLTTGIDFSGEFLHDSRPGYPTYGIANVNGEWEIDYDSITLTEQTLIAHQRTYTVGAYAQFTYKHRFGAVTAGLRFDHFQVRNLAETNTDKSNVYTGNMPVPRFTVLFNLLPDLQLRANYAMGYRAPQVYDEELHVEASGVKRITTRNAPDLKHETSHSAMLSLDYNKSFQSWGIGCLVEGFYTYLKDAFVNDRTDPDENNFVYYTRHNASTGAHVYGANMEFNYIPVRQLALKLSGTIQKSEYLQASDEFNEGQKSFLRTPNAYGFFMAQWKIWKGLSLDASLNATGPMLIAYEGSAAKNAEEEALISAGELPIRKTPSFFDANFKLTYAFKLASSELQIYGGVKNAFDSFQKDLDVGPERASSYVYGPMLPRTLYVGIKLGNIF